MTVAVAPWAGLAAGFFGIGGGIINVPFMMLALRISKAVAVPTSQLDLTPSAKAGTYRTRDYASAPQR